MPATIYTDIKDIVAVINIYKRYFAGQNLEEFIGRPIPTHKCSCM